MENLFIFVFNSLKHPGNISMAAKLHLLGDDEEFLFDIEEVYLARLSLGCAGP